MRVPDLVDQRGRVRHRRASKTYYHWQNRFDMFEKLAESSAPVNEAAVDHILRLPEQRSNKTAPEKQDCTKARSRMRAPATLFSKIWDQHVIADLGDGLALLHVDRHLLHDLNAMKSLQELRERGYPVRNPELTAATPDHGLSTQPGRTDSSNPAHTDLLKGLRSETSASGIKLYDINQAGQGI